MRKIITIWELLAYTGIGYGTGCNLVKNKCFPYCHNISYIWPVSLDGQKYLTPF